jgi:hypothetical protein
MGYPGWQHASLPDKGGSLLSLPRLWMDRVEKEPAAKMDEMFHRMAWNGVR